MPRRNESITYIIPNADVPTKPNFVKPDQIVTDLYTSGGRYMIIRYDMSRLVKGDLAGVADATDYVGYYHRYTANGALYTGRRPSVFSEKLEFYQHPLLESAERIDAPGERSLNNKLYRAVTGRAFHNHVVPESFYPEPTESHYKAGNIKRYFAMRRTTGEITEISRVTYASYNMSNSVGTDQFNYYVDKIVWSIVGNAQQCREANTRVLSRKETDLPGISRILSDPLEFWRGNDIIDDEYQYTTGGLLRYADGRDYIGFYHILIDGTLKEGVRASSVERATLYRI
jgi:hypothetical protein